MSNDKTLKQFYPDMKYYLSLETLLVTLHAQKTIVCLERKVEVHFDEYTLLRVQ